ncbi:MAG: translesion error-prone DNA polymerase V autoproteolytic subunit [Leucobacter sp.]
MLTPFLLADPSEVTLPIAPEAAQCGFPSPAQDYPSEELSLVEHLIRDRAATYFWRAAGKSMEPVIPDGSLLVVDRGITPVPGRIVIAIVDGDFTIKRLWISDNGQVELRAENPTHPHIVLPELSEMTVWGVVTYIISPAV